MYLLGRSLIDNSTLLLNKRNLYKYDIIIIIFLFCDIPKWNFVFLSPK